MRFGQTLRVAVYPPFKDHYIDYAKLKSLLREGQQPDDAADEWTDEDEQRFCDEIFNVQLEKVARFQQQQFDSLKSRVESAFDKLKDLAPPDTATAHDDHDKGKRVDDGNAAAAAAAAAAEQGGGQSQGQTQTQTQTEDVSPERLSQLERELDSITQDIKELKKYSSVNYTGFLKIVKKHDRKRGDRYRVRPMMQLSLSQRPFNSEKGYAPLLSKLSIMYFAIRQHLEGGADGQLPDLETGGETRNGERYTAHRFWVHPDNLLEVKTLILRHLPTLVYSDSTAKEADGNDAPAVTSIYLDSKSFGLYGQQVSRQPEASSSIRLRWYGQLSDKPDIYVEQKTVDASGNSEEARFAIKEKYVKAFLDGEYAMDKSVQKMQRQSLPAEEIAAFQKTVHGIQELIGREGLSPVLRANYVRTAFQSPADGRVRILIDTDLAFIREDALDADRPCRDPGDWHRADVDSGNMSYPFGHLSRADVSRFPYAVLELKLREDPSRPRHHSRPSWVEDLMSSHLVHPVPRFSKLVHGVASLFEDYVNDLPFWLSDLETDIRKDPQEAFEAEERRRSQRADDVMAVGSLIGAGGRSAASYRASKSSPVARSYLEDRMAADARSQQRQQQQSAAVAAAEARTTPEEGGEDAAAAAAPAAAAGTAPAGSADRGYGTLSSVMPSFSLSRYAVFRRSQQEQQRSGLPEGVVEPAEWIKNAGELKIEPKVWLANERTFLKWQHICILQGSLALALYSAAGEGTVAEAMAIVYTVLAAFSGLWGYHMLRARRAMIVERSGKDFDNMLGPVVLSLGLMAALVFNFVFQYKAAAQRWRDGHDDVNQTVILDELKT
ncbi:VTC domain [Geosmithia morbida]|uniref:VTC domain n=1 Tax=Geosmithia morbida TaxID=1094350 RepID=A0A9P4YXT7_9HYPO|nr:VTC domain [Geosmithia morbida]KAF4123716.1 VTC domain [Geosmithia morbida]